MEVFEVVKEGGMGERDEREEMQVRAGLTEDGVDDVVCLFDGGGEVFCEWHGKVAELGC